jgi:transcriptional regulator with XRE-family HTH domain
MDTKHFAARLEIIKRYRTQERFAQAAEITEANVSKILRGVKLPNADQRRKFEELLETPASRLFGE